MSTTHQRADWRADPFTYTEPLIITGVREAVAIIRALVRPI